MNRNINLADFVIFELLDEPIRDWPRIIRNCLIAWWRGGGRALVALALVED